MKVYVIVEEPNDISSNETTPVVVVRTLAQVFEFMKNRNQREVEYSHIEKEDLEADSKFIGFFEPDVENFDDDSVFYSVFKVDML